MKEISTDSKVSYRLCQAVKSGDLPPDLQEIKCGALSHARWLTTAERLIYMWTRHHGLTGDAKKVLETLVRFCLESYLKLFFDIKVKHTLVDAPYHILTQLRVLRKQPKKVREPGMPTLRMFSYLSWLARTVKTESLRWIKF